MWSWNWLRVIVWNVTGTFCLGVAFKCSHWFVLLQVHHGRRAPCCPPEGRRVPASRHRHHLGRGRHRQGKLSLSMLLSYGGSLGFLCRALFLESCALVPLGRMARLITTSSAQWWSRDYRRRIRGQLVEWQGLQGENRAKICTPWCLFNHVDFLLYPLVD